MYVLLNNNYELLFKNIQVTGAKNLLSCSMKNVEHDLQSILKILQLESSYQSTLNFTFVKIYL